MDNPDRVADHVARAVLGEASVPAPLAAGAWSTAYALTVDGRAMVLRVSRHGGDFVKDETVGTAARGLLPVPAVTVRGEAGGWAYAVSERRTGTALDDLDAGEIAAVLPDLFDVMDAIGRIEIGGRGYGIWAPSRAAPYRSWPEYLLAVDQETPRVPGWRAALAASDVGLEPFERGLATLRRLVPGLPDERRMFHKDLLNRNLLAEGDRISGILEWGSAGFGDPLYDAAWLLYCWGWYPQWSTVDIEAAIGRRWNPDPAALRAYQLHIGLGSIGYCATRDRWDDVALNAEWLLALA
ncbi:phosphotransferase [Actinoplanes sp. NPDC049596]|uniref:phosphotransferase family protein n=1 Tax=unclassified Actinoplanes TaxID=2626549 RepID=UPI003422765D